MPTIPREWSYSVQAGGTPTIILPAGGPNLRRILTLVEARVYTNAAVGGAPVYTVSVYNGATFMETPIVLVIDGAVAASSDSDSWSGSYTSTPGNGLTVRFTFALGANTFAVLRVKGYDL